jgi:hypothetical protein
MPEAFTEGRLDVNALKRALGETSVVESGERYRLDWARCFPDIPNPHRRAQVPPPPSGGKKGVEVDVGQAAVKKTPGHALNGKAYTPSSQVLFTPERGINRKTTRTNEPPNNPRVLGNA